jgi:hypothetical protein
LRGGANDGDIKLEHIVPDLRTDDRDCIGGEDGQLDGQRAVQGNRYAGFRQDNSADNIQSCYRDVKDVVESDDRFLVSTARLEADRASTDGHGRKLMPKTIDRHGVD